LWQYLFNFREIRLGPIARRETALLVQSAVAAGRVPAMANEYTSALHRLSRGNPRALEELLIEMSSRDYHLDALFGRKLLELDRRIHSATTLAAAQMSEASNRAVP
jgi:hypothetical protein